MITSSTYNSAVRALRAASNADVYVRDVLMKEAEKDLGRVNTRGYYYNGTIKTIEMIGSDERESFLVFLLNHEIGHHTIFPKTAFLRDTIMATLSSKYRNHLFMNVAADMIVNYYQCHNKVLQTYYPNVFAEEMLVVYKIDKPMASDDIFRLLYSFMLDVAHEFLGEKSDYCEQMDSDPDSPRKAVKIRKLVKKLGKLDRKSYIHEVINLIKLVSKYSPIPSNVPQQVTGSAGSSSRQSGRIAVIKRMFETAARERGWSDEDLEKALSGIDKYYGGDSG